jgi:multidrug efflux pump
MTIAAGASAKSQQALGTVVMGGMTAVVILALLMVPIFFVTVQAFFNRDARRELQSAAAGGTDVRPDAQAAGAGQG